MKFNKVEKKESTYQVEQEQLETAIANLGDEYFSAYLKLMQNSYRSGVSLGSEKIRKKYEAQKAAAKKRKRAEFLEFAEKFKHKRSINKIDVYRIVAGTLEFFEGVLQRKTNVLDKHGKPTFGPDGKPIMEPDINTEDLLDFLNMVIPRYVNEYKDRNDVTGDFKEHKKGL